MRRVVPSRNVGENLKTNLTKNSASVTFRRLGQNYGTKAYLEHFREFEVERVDPRLNIREHLRGLRVAVVVQEGAVRNTTVLRSLAVLVRLGLDSLKQLL